MPKPNFSVSTLRNSFSRIRCGNSCVLRRKVLTHSFQTSMHWTLQITLSCTWRPKNSSKILSSCNSSGLTSIPPSRNSSKNRCRSGNGTVPVKSGAGEPAVFRFLAEDGWNCSAVGVQSAIQDSGICVVVDRGTHTNPEEAGFIGDFLKPGFLKQFFKTTNVVSCRGKRDFARSVSADSGNIPGFLPLRQGSVDLDYLCQQLAGRAGFSPGGKEQQDQFCNTVECENQKRCPDYDRIEWNLPPVPGIESNQGVPGDG